jgi:hypothetical protein
VSSVEGYGPNRRIVGAFVPGFVWGVGDSTPPKAASQAIVYFGAETMDTSLSKGHDTQSAAGGQFLVASNHFCFVPTIKSCSVSIF